MLERRSLPLTAACVLSLFEIGCSAGADQSARSPTLSTMPAGANAGSFASNAAAGHASAAGTAGSFPTQSNTTATAGRTGASAGAPATTTPPTGTLPPPPTAAGAGTAAPPPAATAGSSALTPPPNTPPTPHGSDTCLQAGSGNYTEPGPYKTAMMDVDLGMIEANQHTGKFTIFYPTPLEANCPHPIVSWANGTGVDNSATYAFFNNNAASWGIVVAASQEQDSGSGNFNKAGIDWLLKQNADPTSMFYNKLSTRAGVAGHSQGGFGATQGTQHPNVEALVSVAGGGIPKMGVATLCITGTMDMVEQPCTQEYMSASGPSFLADWMNGDHVTTETAAGYFMKDPGTLQFQRIYAAWFRCWLADDQKACALFKGAPDNCGICKDTGWAKHESRNF